MLELLPFKAVKQVIQATNDLDVVIEGIYEEKKQAGYQQFKPSADTKDLVTHLCRLFFSAPTTVLNRLFTVRANAIAAKDDTLSEGEIRSQLGTLLWASADTSKGDSVRLIPPDSNPHIKSKTSIWCY
jgi:cytochrome P450